MTIDDALRKRVEARAGPVHEQPVPSDPDDIRRLMLDDPDRFNVLLEAGRIDPANVKPVKKKGANK